MQELSKEVSLLYIIHNDSLLMRKFIHQNGEVLDVFNVQSDDAIDGAVNAKLMSLFGKTFPYIYYGDIESIINKEGMVVHIHIKTYKVLVDEVCKILSNYTDDVVKGSDQIIWLHKNNIGTEKRLREGDRKILERIFDEKDIHIKIIEDQGGVWLDAKTILFEDK